MISEFDIPDLDRLHHSNRLFNLHTIFNISCPSIVPLYFFYPYICPQYGSPLLSLVFQTPLSNGRADKSLCRTLAIKTVSSYKYLKKIFNNYVISMYIAYKVAEQATYLGVHVTFKANINSFK